MSPAADYAPYYAFTERKAHFCSRGAHVLSASLREALGTLLGGADGQGPSYSAEDLVRDSPFVVSQLTSYAKVGRLKGCRDGPAVCRSCV